MTYYEKLRSAIKIDRELLDEAGVERLEVRIEAYLTCNCCPGCFFPGAPAPDVDDDYKCPVGGSCSECWKQEVEPNADR